MEGYPARSPEHGALGWSSVTLIQSGGKNVLVDTGSFGIRRLLAERLSESNLAMRDIDIVLLSHAHWDHMCNWPLFTNAIIVIGREELEWATRDDNVTSPIPKESLECLKRSSKIRIVEDREEIAPGISAVLTRGHTPGHMAYAYEHQGSRLLFTGDAAKNRAELASHQVDMTLNNDWSIDSLARIWGLWEADPQTIVIPGHDAPLVLKHGVPEYLNTRTATVKVWEKPNFGDVTLVHLP
jgi:glyoxylase-like metal-dependent hydrolase (beta-lactamase superfamily II)